MNTKLKLSQWHNGKIKPVNVGVYEINVSDTDVPSFFRKFDGINWLTCDYTAEQAALKTEISPFQKEKWRGIVK